MLISSAFAQAATTTAEAPSMVNNLLLMGGVFVFFWFFMIRPQMKKTKETQKMMSALREGDEVMTTSGIAGRITKLSDNFVKIEIAANVEITVQRPAVASILPEGTINSL